MLGIGSHDNTKITTIMMIIIIMIITMMIRLKEGGVSGALVGCTCLHASPTHSPRWEL